MADQQEIFEKVQEVLVDALGVDDDEVTLQAKLVGDLGAESIDFLDIVFRLEKAFGIKIEQSELFPEDVLSNEEYVQDGKVTDKGMEELKAKMKHAESGRGRLLGCVHGGSDREVRGRQAGLTRGFRESPFLCESAACVGFGSTASWNWKKLRSASRSRTSRWLRTCCTTISRRASVRTAAGA